MKTLALGALLALGLAVGTASPSFAAGDGLDKDAAAQGNGHYGNMHSQARMGSGAAMRGHRMMRHTRHHRHHHRHHR